MYNNPIDQTTEEAQLLFDSFIKNSLNTDTTPQKLNCSYSLNNISFNLNSPIRRINSENTVTVNSIKGNFVDHNNGNAFRLMTNEYNTGLTIGVFFFYY